MIKIYSITPIKIDYNKYYGFTFELLDLELRTPININNPLIGIYLSKDFFIVSLFFKSITIFNKYKK